MKASPENIREHMEVIGADGGHVGTVDGVDGQRIKLTRDDRGAGGQHHWLPMSLLADVEGNQVRLSITLERVDDFWESEAGPSGNRGTGEALRGGDPGR